MNVLRFSIAWSTPGGDLYLQNPSQAAPPNRLTFSKWSSKVADAYRWPTRESAERYAHGDAMVDSGQGIEIFEVDVVTDLMDLSAMDPYVVSLDENAPDHVVREVSRSTPNKRGGKTRISYKGVT